ncbi:uncharacterized protein LOC110007619 [Amborella trichopoda]|uniref:uncharacterized protein LOC110007619 n=1 Tax=Amborella trichopoda TaxID=13333 RepID=UPI0009BE286C|nr:uncharacterized protein LOC110007619 [Amborella trichopoda]|eukprot:XP_020525396.1 uncharacterized protein LOC110007619 [Amborella trichopoda]
MSKEGWGISKVDVMINLPNLFLLDMHKCRPKGLWVSPPLGCIKLNFDGSFFGNPGPAGIGRVFQYSSGVEIFMERHMGSLCVIEGDSLNMIQWYRKDQQILWELHYLWLKILDVTSSISVSFSHVYREANGIVDTLAKGRVSLASLTTANDVISFL